MLCGDKFYCSYTVYFIKPTTTLFKKYILKMDSTVLFIYLKIILLQYFLIFNF